MCVQIMFSEMNFIIFSIMSILVTILCFLNRCISLYFYTKMLFLCNMPWLKKIETWNLFELFSVELHIQNGSGLLKVMRVCIKNAICLFENIHLNQLSVKPLQIYVLEIGSTHFKLFTYTRNSSSIWLFFGF